MAHNNVDAMDHFAILGLTASASEADIRRAHKKLSLALHPDKNRGVDPVEAAARFSEMQLAYEALMDPVARQAAAKRSEAEAAQKERRGQYEGKRKAMAEELERREEEERTKRQKSMQDQRRRQETLARLREEGRQLREERERKANAATQVPSSAETKRDSRPSSPPAPEMGPLDKTIKVRFPSSMYDRLVAISPGGSFNECTLARALTVRFGFVESIVVKEFKSNKRESTAHVTFSTLEAAHAAVEAGSRLEAGGPGEAQVLEDVWCGWASGKEPERVGWLRRQNGQQKKTADAATTHAPTNESDILRRMREAGRQSG